MAFLANTFLFEQCPPPQKKQPLAVPHVSTEPNCIYQVWYVCVVCVCVGGCAGVCVGVRVCGRVCVWEGVCVCVCCVCVEGRKEPLVINFNADVVLW